MSDLYTKGPRDLEPGDLVDTEEAAKIYFDFWKIKNTTHLVLEVSPNKQNVRLADPLTLCEYTWPSIFGQSPWIHIHYLTRHV